MNIFKLHENPQICAAMHCDKHVVKMILETAQMLSTAHRMSAVDNEYADEHSLYKAAYKNHPSTVWVRNNLKNYMWTCSLFLHLCKEYTKRYDRHHSSEELYEPFQNTPQEILFNDGGRRLAFPQCMPDQYKVKYNPVKAYPNYYAGEKARFAKWEKGTPAPKWWSKSILSAKGGVVDRV